MKKKTALKIFIPIVSFVLIVAVVAITLLSCLVFNRFSQGIVPTAAQVQALCDNDRVYDHVVIFGVDGAGGYFGEMDTPGFDSVFKNSAMGASLTYTAMSQFPTESGYNWTSMIHGVWCGKHKIDNDTASTKKYTDTKYPSLFKIYADRHPDAYMASVADWPAINYGIIEDFPQIKKIDAGNFVNYNSGLSWIEGEKLIDTAVAERAINEIKNNNPKILFTHFDCVDAAGHCYGTGKAEYIDAMSYVDRLIGEIFDACKEEGWDKNTLFICISDHGHKYNGGHGNNQAVVRNVTFAVAGAKGNIIAGSPKRVVTQDMAAVVFYALGEEQPSCWDGSVPKNMFKDL